MSTVAATAHVRHYYDVVATIDTVEPSGETERAAWDRQFATPRLSAYGVDLGDILLFQRMRRDGMPWQPAAEAIAENLAHGGETAGVPVSKHTRRERKRRASAMLRMSQMFDDHDDAHRRDVYSRAAELFEEAHEGAQGFERVLLPTDGGPLAAWWFRSDRADSPVVAIIGGGEGWAMDWEAAASALNQRGVSVLLVDGPGQGETRLLHEHYLTTDWLECWGQVARYLKGESGNGRIGILGNSMGGTFATLIASRWTDFEAVCNNGGPQVPTGQRARPRFWRKLASFCARDDDAHVDAVWESVELTQERAQTTASYLSLYASNDPLISSDEAWRVFDWVPSEDKQFHTFLDADHCVYRFPTDKDSLVGDWFADRLAASAGA